MMEYRHVPVMSGEATEGLNIKSDGVYVDGTLGGGGHASMICDRLGKCALFVGIDRDREAIEVSKERLSEYECQKIFVHAEFANINEIRATHGIAGLDGALLDIGVSSRQLDTPQRGFSYMERAPLDMRMDKDSSGITAYDVVNGYTENELSRIIKDYGEERWASRIAAFVVRERKEGLLETTEDLVKVIKAAIPASARREGPHPAKRTFQAIRIEVNGELEQIEKAVDRFTDALNTGGRLAIITFHSLEDRIVKEAFKRRENPCICPPDIPKCVCGRVSDVKRVNRKPILPTQEETRINPRARSAKLRILEKT